MVSFKQESVLYGTPKTSDPVITSRNSFSWSLTPNATPTKQLGYLAFPTGRSPFVLHAEPAGKPQEESARREAEEAEEARRKREESEAAAWDAEQERLRKLHEARLAREAEEARKGEEYWVSCGGVLRDEHGRRDLERTRKIREELRLREVEKRLTELWENYERRWQHLLSLTKRQKLDGMDSGAESETGSQVEEEAALKFADIPWPADKISTDVKLEDLTSKFVEQFLLEPLTVRGCKVTKKERVRSSLLRWHPDKITAIVAMVDPAEKDAVMDGIHAVIRILRRLNAKV